MLLEIESSGPLTKHTSFWQAYSDLKDRGFALVLTSTNLLEGDFGSRMVDIFQTPLNYERFSTAGVGYTTFSLRQNLTTWLFINRNRIDVRQYDAQDSFSDSLRVQLANEGYGEIVGIYPVQPLFAERLIFYKEKYPSKSRQK